MCEGLHGDSLLDGSSVGMSQSRFCFVPVISDPVVENKSLLTQNLICCLHYFDLFCRLQNRSALKLLTSMPSRVQHLSSSALQ